MTKPRCLQFYELLLLVSKKLDDEKLEYINEHRQNCKHCDERIHLLQNLFDSMPENRKDVNRQMQARAHEHISAETQEFYSQGTLSTAELEDVHRHLLQCLRCFQEFSDISANANAEIPEAEEAILTDIEAAEIADRLAPYKRQFMSSLEQSSAYVREKPTRFKDLVNTLIPDHRLRWGLLGVVVLILLILPVKLGIKHYKIMQTIETAEQNAANLLSNYRVVAGKLRPTGGFERGMIEKTRAAATGEDILTPTIQHAFDLRPDNAKLNHQVGTLYFFQGEIDKAEDYYLKALVLDENNAKIYNDLALIDVERKQFEQAVKHLQQALKLQPTLPEAQYNLAIVRELMADKANAIKAWKKYIELDSEPNSEWNKIAKAHLQELTRE